MLLYQSINLPPSGPTSAASNDAGHSHRCRGGVGGDRADRRDEQRVLGEFDAYGTNALHRPRAAPATTVELVPGCAQEYHFDELLERCPSISAIARAGYGGLPIYYRGQPRRPVEFRGRRGSRSNAAASMGAGDHAEIARRSPVCLINEEYAIN
jgi:hypothetical protein